MRSVALCPKVVITEGNLLTVTNVGNSSYIEEELYCAGELIFSTILDHDLATQLPALESTKEYSLVLTINGVRWQGHFAKD